MCASVWGRGSEAPFALDYPPAPRAPPGTGADGGGGGGRWAEAAQRRSIIPARVTNPLCVISEGARFVKRAPKAPLAVSVAPDSAEALADGRAEANPLLRRIEQGGQGRPQAARRGSLDGPVSCSSHHGLRSPQGFVVVPL